MNNNTKPDLPQGYYQHYKGRYYQVVDLAMHSETAEWLVIYRALYGDFGLWARPATMFSENVDIAGELSPRFSYVGSTLSKALSSLANTP
ncbi:DUF1653 domain-containing protein [Rheinheimera sp. UJ63]|uniref:DUF1653 domain-containing protein n=1 Tax=Rheinheimera sp. UJ63 TaxID=2910157 RepID=UPI001F3320D2|nr:DUF1653 domain-containing protein [Rheinheimera sp. UJ63]MCF4009140.1 DUF1653 domain-containing protein [Rheinheimera sp. UJ63]